MVNEQTLQRIREGQDRVHTSELGWVWSLKGRRAVAADGTVHIDDLRFGPSEVLKAYYEPRGLWYETPEWVTHLCVFALAMDATSRILRV